MLLPIHTKVTRPTMPVAKDPVAFTDVMADILRLCASILLLLRSNHPVPNNCFPRPDEAIAMSHIYLNRYLRFQRTSTTTDPLDPYVRLPSSLTDNPLPFTLPFWSPGLLKRLSKIQDTSISMRLSRIKGDRSTQTPTRNPFPCPSLASPT